MPLAVPPSVERMAHIHLENFVFVLGGDGGKCTDGAMQGKKVSGVGYYPMNPDCPLPGKGTPSLGKLAYVPRIVSQLLVRHPFPKNPNGMHGTEGGQQDLQDRVHVGGFARLPVNGSVHARADSANQLCLQHMASGKNAAGSQI